MPPERAGWPAEGDTTPEVPAVESSGLRTAWLAGVHSTGKGQRSCIEQYPLPLRERARSGFEADLAVETDVG